MELHLETPATTIRDMLEIKSDREPIPIDEVEPVEAIMRRFNAGASVQGDSWGAPASVSFEC